MKSIPSNQTIKKKISKNQQKFLHDYPKQTTMTYINPNKFTTKIITTLNLDKNSFILKYPPLIIKLSFKLEGIKSTKK